VCQEYANDGGNDDVGYRADAKGERSMLDEAVYTAGDLMTRDVAVVHPETSLLEAVKLMARRKISGMPVVNDAGAIVGMISEGDLVRWHEGYSGRQARWLDMLAEGTELAPAFLKEIQDQNRKVKSIMAAGATTVTENTLAREMARLLHTKNIKRVPVVRDGKLVGIVARSDLVRALAQTLGEEPPPLIELETMDVALRRRREETLRKPVGS
jgi:CBS domain-containing protein